jgi:hypothetical protein
MNLTDIEQLAVIFAVSLALIVTGSTVAISVFGIRLDGAIALTGIAGMIYVGLIGIGVA